MSHKRVAIVGGGAAGIFTAITCAEADPEAQVTVFERSRQFLSKVRISGGGRCNVTHHCFEPEELVQRYPRGGTELLGAFYQWQPRDTIEWYRDRGVELKVESDGRMFPTTDDSQTIVDCLLDSAENAHVRLQAQIAVEAIALTDQGEFALTTKAGETQTFTHLALATGGGQKAGHALAQSLGHTITSLAPSLFTFNIKSPLLEGLAGLSIKNARVTYAPAKLTQSGPILVTHWGLSGPGILKLSAWGARAFSDQGYRFSVTVNWLYDCSQKATRQSLAQSKNTAAKKQVVNHCPFDLPRRFWHNLVIYSGISETIQWAHLSKSNMDRLTQNLVFCQLPVEGKSANKEEFVTCGGISLKEIDFKRMVSKIVSNLHITGEALDIDGVTGGFNFQSAWTTGRIAGLAIAHD